MNDLRLLELAAHVVAWHNRHPLARRIRAEHVHSMGYVVLPFVGPAGPAAPASSLVPDAAGNTPAPDAAGDTPAPDAAGDPSTLPVVPGAPDGPAGGSLRERAMARAQQDPGAVPLAPPLPAAPAAPAAPTALAAANAPLAPSGRALKRGFGEDFIAPLSPRRVARWAARHGVVMLTPRQEAPVRRVAAEPGHDTERLTDRWMLTAQVQSGSHRTRVLVGAGAAPALLGQRLWSPARVAALAAMVGAMVATLAALQSGAFDPGSALPAPRAAASAPADAASASVPAPAPAPAASAVVAADWPASAPSPSAWEPAGASSAPLVMRDPQMPAVQRAAPAPSASAAAPPAGPPAALPKPAPVDVEPTLGRIDLPSLGPVIDERRRNQALARQQAPATAPAAGATVPTAAAAAAASAEIAAAPQASTAAPPAPVLQGPAFAVSTRLLRTRSEGEQVAEAMRALLVPPGSRQMQVDLLPAGADWRVVSWPYPSRAQADKARAMLAARGMRVEIIDF